MDVGGKGSNDYPLITVFKQHIKGLAHLALGGGVTRLFNIGRIAQKRQNALVAELSEAGQIDHIALNGCDIYLKVTCVDDSAKRCFDGKSHCVSDTVVYIYKFYAEAAKAEYISGLFCEDLSIIKQVMLLKL